MNNNILQPNVREEDKDTIYPKCILHTGYYNPTLENRIRILYTFKYILYTGISQPNVRE